MQKTGTPEALEGVRSLEALDGVLNAVGPRLRALRQRRGVTLASLSESTGISISTLSRLESGQRKPSLELLLPLAQAHGVALDELVGAPPTGDPRVHLQSVQRHGMTFVPLTRRPGGLQAYKQILPPDRNREYPPQLRTHEGYEWLYILNGKLRLLLADQEFVLSAGEVVEFDTRTPHWFGCAGKTAVEFLSLYGPQGERMHVKELGKELAAKPIPGSGDALRNGE